MTDSPDPRPWRREPGEGDYSADLARWLAEGDDGAPDRIAQVAIERVESVRQRPGWLARLTSANLTYDLARAGVLVATAGLAVAVGLRLSAEIGRPGPSPGASGNPTAGPSVTEFASLLDQATAQYQTGRRDNSAVGSGFESVWVAALDGEVVRMDPTNGEVVARIPIEAEGCGALQASPRSIWVQTCGRGPSAGRRQAETLRIDPSGNVVANTFGEAGADGIGIGAVDDAVWFISDASGGVMTVVDDSTGSVVREVELGLPISHVGSGFGLIWVSPVGRSELIGLDPTTGVPEVELAVGGQPGFIVTSTDALWVGLPNSGQVVRIEPVERRVTDVFDVGPQVELLAVGDGRVWAVANTHVVAIDQVSLQEVAHYRVPPHHMYDTARLVFAAGFGSVWWADRTTLYEVPDP